MLKHLFIPYLTLFTVCIASCSSETPVNEEVKARAKVDEFFSGSEETLNEQEEKTTQSAEATESAGVAFRFSPSPISLVADTELKIELKFDNPNDYLLDPLNINIESANESFMKITPTDNRFVFQINGLTDGKSTLIANVNGTEKNIPVEIQENKIESLEISPKSIRVGSLQEMKLQATYTNGDREDISENISWQVQNSDYAAIDTINTRAILGRKVGEVVIVANYKQSESTPANKIASPIKILMPNINQIDVVPYWLDYPTDKHNDLKNESILIGKYATYKAMATFGNGTIFDITSSVSWSTGSSGEAEVDSSGNATARKSGIANLTATYGDTSSTRQILIKNQEVDKIEFSPAEVILVPEGFAKEVYLNGTLPDNTTEAMAAWSTFEIENQSIAKIVDKKPATVYETDENESASSEESESSESSDPPPTTEYILVQGLKKGESTTITATYDKQTAQAEVKVTDAVITEILVEANETETFCGEGNLVYTAKGLFSNGQEEDITNLVAWSLTDSTLGNISSDPVNSPSSMGHVTSVLPGITKVVATFVDFEGKQLTDSETITIKSPNIVGIELRLSESAAETDGIAVGENISISAFKRLACETPEDNQDVSSFIDYSVSHTGGAGCSVSVNSSGVVDTSSCNRDAQASPLAISISATSNDISQVKADTILCKDPFASSCQNLFFNLRPKEITSSGLSTGALFSDNDTLNAPWELEVGGNTWDNPLPFSVTYSDGSKDEIQDNLDPDPTITDYFDTDKYGSISFVVKGFSDYSERYHAPCSDLDSTQTSDWATNGCPTIDQTTGKVTSGSSPGRFTVEITYNSHSAVPKAPVVIESSAFKVKATCVEAADVKLVDSMFCFYSGTVNQTCTQVCTAKGLTYDEFGTKNYAGHSSSRTYADNEDSCRRVVAAFTDQLPTEIVVTENPNAAAAGLGCFAFIQPSPIPPAYYFNSYADTDPDDNNPDVERFCSCK